MSKQNPVMHQQKGVSLRAFSEQTGIREGQLLHYIHKGQILGARKHPLTKKWWVYPPAKLVLGAAHSPRIQACNEAARDMRRPQTPAAIEAVVPLIADRVSPGVLPSVYAAPRIQDDGRDIRRAAAEVHYPLVLSASQMVLPDATDLSP